MFLDTSLDIQIKTHTVEKPLPCSVLELSSEMTVISFLWCTGADLLKRHHFVAHTIGM